jgi:PAS domain S-box-containing protein
MPTPMSIPATALPELLAVAVVTAGIMAAIVAVWHRRSRSTALLRALVEHSGDAIAVVDGDGRLHGLTGAVRDVLGRRPEGLRGRPLAEFAHPEDGEAVDALAAAQPPREVAMRVRHPAGFWLPVVIGVADLRADRAVRGLVLRIRDASE